MHHEVSMIAKNWIVVGRFVRLVQELAFVRRFCTAFISVSNLRGHHGVKLEHCSLWMHEFYRMLKERPYRSTVLGVEIFENFHQREQ
jgi:hypothetical protein